MESGLLKRYKVHPNKRLGQNFLVSRTVLKKIIKAGELKSSDIVLEIGPGLGILTKAIAKKVKKV
ncbi:16S rRNA (adenine(1518)-N(6)/adenine(1519)-N(6))-dimethyltransferase, partial [bacterium (Candidatus Gribaldobacteria) CG_4_10_14_0_2_um_filter_36_18]